MKKFFLMLLFPILLLRAATYNFPSDLTKPPFNCSGSGNSYICNNDLNFGNNDTLNITSDITITIDKDFDAGNKFTINTFGNTLDLILLDDFIVGNDFSASATVNITAKDDVQIGRKAGFAGTIVAGDDVDIDRDGILTGNITAADNLDLGTNTIVYGACSPSHSQCTGVSTPVIPIADYRLDECGWAGMAGEVSDSSSGYDGVAQGSTTIADAQIGRSGDLSKDANVDYIVLDHNAMNGLGNLSVGVWVKTSDTSPQQEILQGLGSSSSDDEFELYLQDKNGLRINIGDSGEDFKLKNNEITDGAWHQIFITRNSSTVCLYIDGSEKECKSGFSTGILAIHEGSLIVGQEQDSYGGDFDPLQNFVGYLDELKIFDSALGAVEISKIYDNENAKMNYDGAVRADIDCTFPTPALDYRMDECAWGDVVDSSGNSLTGRAKNGAKSSAAESQVGGRSGLFSKAQTQYIDSGDVLNDVFGTSSSSFTVTAWLRPLTLSTDATNHMTRNTFFAKASDSYNDNIEFGMNPDGTIHLYIDTGAIDTYTDTTIRANDTAAWNFVAVRYESGVVTVKINENEETLINWSGATTLDNAMGSPVTIASTEHINNYFDGYIDELKVFGEALTPQWLNKIYTEELDGKNYDGAVRVPLECISTLAYDFGEITIAAGTTQWRSIVFTEPFATPPVVFSTPARQGSEDPGTVKIKEVTTTGFKIAVIEPPLSNSNDYDGTRNSDMTVSYFAVSKGSHMLDGQQFIVGSISTKKIQSRYLLTGETGGWETVNGVDVGGSMLVIADTQTMNNEGLNPPGQRSDPFAEVTVSGVTGSSFQIALERAETASNMNRLGRRALTQDEEIGYMAVNSGAAGSLYKNASEYKFEALRTSSSVTHNDYTVNFSTLSDQSYIVASQNTRNGGDGGWVQFDDPNSGHVKVSILEDETGDTDRSHITETVGLFAIEKFSVIVPVTQNFHFDVWDTFRNINDRNISTQVAGKDISLTLAALNETNDGYQDFNGTVCAQVVDVGNGSAVKSAWVKSSFSESNATVITLHVDSAAKNSRVKMVWKKDVDESCPLSGEDNTTLSTDNFAIRPNRYDCGSIVGNIYIAEQGYDATILATPYANDAAATPDYNTSHTGISVMANLYMPSGESNNSLHGSLTLGSFDFLDGSADVQLRFNDVARVGIDINDSMWADVDADDTDMNDRAVYTECNVTFRPDHFEVNLTKPQLENNASSGFTYLSNLPADGSMSAWMKNLQMTVTSKGEANSTMLNYSEGLYANDVSILPELTLPSRHSSADKYIDLVDANGSDMSGFSFSNGIATYTYADVGFNYERQYDKPVAPFSVDGSESYFYVFVQDKLYSTVTGEDNESANGNVAFYYGRLRAQDVETTEVNVENFVVYEVFDDTHSAFIAGMNQTRPNWYANNKHTSSNEGDVTEAVDASSTNIDTRLNKLNFLTQLNKITINNPEGIKKATIHLKTQPWLWYVPEAFGSAYDDTSGTNCTQHPCFGYRYIEEGASIIESGDFTGTKNPDINRSDYVKKGIKLFR